MSAIPIGEVADGRPCTVWERSSVNGEAPSLRYFVGLISACLRYTPEVCMTPPLCSFGARMVETGAAREVFVVVQVAVPAPTSPTMPTGDESE